MALSEKQAVRLVAGDRVVYCLGTKHEVHGTVREVHPLQILIAWDDSLPGAVHPDDMSNYSMEV